MYGLDEVRAGHDDPSPEPATSRASPKPQRPDPAPVRVPTGNGGFLVVEDAPLDATLIRKLLARSFPEAPTRIVGTLAEAVETLPGEFELILLNLGLPDGHGLDAVLQMLDAAKGIPIVVLTGMDDADLARQCLEHGVQDFVVKHTLDEATLRRAIGYARARDHAQRLTQQLQHVDRLAAIGRLVAAVAHEVNNPAAFIRLNTEELLHQVSDLHALLEGPEPRPDAESLREWLDELRTILVDNLDGVERVTRLLRDLQPLTKSRAQNIDRVDAAEACRSTCDALDLRPEHRTHLRLRLDPVPAVQADPGRLGQVVANLVLNAMQSLDGPDDDDEVVVTTSTSGPWVLVTVRDTGCGIAPEDRARIFEPFYSTKPKTKNTGLGLSISQEIVQSLGGKIDFESQPNKGTCFFVRLPIAEAISSDESQLARPSPPLTALARRRILLVDDEPKVLEALGRCLAHHHEITLASSGHEALAVLHDNDRFDVVVCDLVMPGLDGVALIERIRAQYPTLTHRIIVLSGGAATPRTAAFVDHTDLPILNKPISADMILGAIEDTARRAAPPRAPR
ncbi:MAG: response regulator [Myxococcota bacterium]